MREIVKLLLLDSVKCSCSRVEILLKKLSEMSEIIMAKTYVARKVRIN